MPNNTTVDQMTKAQEWALEQMKANQERVIDLNRRAASLVEKLPRVKIPFSDRLPDQTVVLNKYYDFLLKSTEANREFATAITDVWNNKIAEEVPSPASTPRPAAKRTTKARSSAKR
jgi:hypothetical protein